MKNLLLSLIGLLLVAGCASTGSKVQVTSIDDTSRSPNSGQVIVYSSEDAIPDDRDHTDIAELRIEDRAGQEQKAITSFQAKAASLGADAIYLLENDAKLLYVDGVATHLTIYHAVAIAFEN